jgi:hypothetical protein
MRRRWCLVAALAAVAGCGDDGGTIEPDVKFPIETYADTYVEVRDCRQSGGAHDINHIRVLADPAALDPYNNRTDPFAEGAIVLKEEYELGDTTCSGPVVQWSVMVRLGADAPAELMGWSWQRVSSLGVVLEDDTPRCFGCHQGCGFPPDGYEGTCTVP